MRAFECRCLVTKHSSSSPGSRRGCHDPIFEFRRETVGNMKKWFSALALPCFGVSCWMAFKHMDWWVILPLFVGWAFLACAFISRPEREAFHIPHIKLVLAVLAIPCAYAAFLLWPSWCSYILDGAAGVLLLPMMSNTDDCIVGFGFLHRVMCGKKSALWDVLWRAEKQGKMGRAPIEKRLYRLGWDGKATWRDIDVFSDS